MGKEQNAAPSINEQAYALGRIYRTLSDLLDRKPTAATLDLAAQRPMQAAARLMALAHRAHIITPPIGDKLAQHYELINVADWENVFEHAPLEVQARWMMGYMKRDR